MTGQPSMNFIKKIYNIISYKEEKIEEIKLIENRLKDQFNGDVQLALEQCKNGNYTSISKSELNDVIKKPLIEQSLDEHKTIFNIYKGFHRQNRQPDSASIKKTTAS